MFGRKSARGDGIPEPRVEEQRREQPRFQGFERIDKYEYALLLLWIGTSRLVRENHATAVYLPSLSRSHPGFSTKKTVPGMHHQSYTKKGVRRCAGETFSLEFSLAHHVPLSIRGLLSSLLVYSQPQPPTWRGQPLQGFSQIRVILRTILNSNSKYFFSKKRIAAVCLHTIFNSISK